MHPSALSNCQRFFACYGRFLPDHARVVEIGSQDVNGSLRQVCPDRFDYVGVDFVAAPGVDVVLDDPYELPFPTGSVDIVVSSSCLEHSELFWLSYLEMLRVLAPSGLLYLNVPSNGAFHRYPVDCWRFYPESGRALVTWARRNRMDVAMLESFVTTSPAGNGGWNDFVAVFAREAGHVGQYPFRITSFFEDFNNGLVHGSDEFLRPSDLPEDQRRLLVASQVLSGEVAV